MWLFEHVYGRVVLVSVVTALLTTFLRMYSHPLRNPFRRAEYTREDLNFGIELTLAALISYLAAAADVLARGGSSPLTEHFFDAVPILIITSMAIPMYLRADGWSRVGARRYTLRTRGVIVPNVIGVGALIYSMFLVGGLPK